MSHTALLLPLILVALIATPALAAEAPALPADQRAEVAQGLIHLRDVLAEDHAGLNQADRETLSDIHSVLEDSWAQEMIDTWEHASTSGDADDRPTEEVAFYYNKISFRHSATTQGAGVLKLNKLLAEWSTGKGDRPQGLQEAIQMESRRFSMVSNILKTRHDTAKNSVGNIR